MWSFLIPLTSYPLDFPPPSFPTPRISHLPEFFILSVSVLFFLLSLICFISFSVFVCFVFVFVTHLFFFSFFCSLFSISLLFCFVFFSHGNHSMNSDSLFPSFTLFLPASFVTGPGPLNDLSTYTFARSPQIVATPAYSDAPGIPQSCKRSSC